VKPENILLDRRDRVRLIDLGFACEMQWSSGGPSDVTLGTAEYVSPEQARGERKLTTATDIYSLGLVLCFMIGGRHPFEGTSPEEVMRRRFGGGVALPDLEGLGVEGRLREVIARMVQPRPRDRYRDYGELLGALQGLPA
jgi:serine/threonine-protein kinase